ncbi:hypothetical protein LS70_008735 [Helicobacter sp. MIT 11-5569]|jgi:hypothetical protein|uniref:hypothetical protein n=1 Tax=Helicobacter TaxID=209 RepID=UPI00047B84BD|nr:MULTISPECIES: hypothetical protein [Helicobacter]TLD80754.1 hypothetical protein LS70_008735 [Helicobacter sp. MIT 11-5569]
MAYPLLGTKIVLDEEKILREGKYNLEDMYKAIDEIAQDCKLIKKDKYTYHCMGDKNDLARLGNFVYGNLMEIAWFTKNIKEWIWISEKEGNEELIGDEMGVW